jgi:hypothetical protein
LLFAKICKKFNFFQANRVVNNVFVWFIFEVEILNRAGFWFVIIWQFSTPRLEIFDVFD